MNSWFIVLPLKINADLFKSTLFFSDIGETDLLLIDGMVNNMGPAVSDLWMKEGGSGLYPPPSLHVSYSINQGYFIKIYVGG